MDVAKGNTELLHIAYFNHADIFFIWKGVQRGRSVPCIFKISLVVLLIGS